MLSGGCAAQAVANQMNVGGVVKQDSTVLVTMDRFPLGSQPYVTALPSLAGCVSAGCALGSGFEVRADTRFQ